MAENRRSAKKIVGRAIVVILLLIASIMGWRFFTQSQNRPSNIIFVSGRIESDDSAVAAKVGGRIQTITVREGDKVTAGQIIAILADPQTLAREDQARQAQQEAQAHLERARQQIAVLQEALNQSRLGFDQAKIDVQGRVRQAEAQLAAAQAQLAQTQAVAEQANYDANKFAGLAEQGVESARTAHQYRSNADAQAAVVRAAQKQVEAYQGALDAVQANLTNPAIRTSQTAAINQQIHQAEADIAAAQAEKSRADAQLKEAEANHNDLSILAPFEGVVAVRSAEPGEVIAAGTPIITLIDLKLIYLRGYVPEGDIGKVRVGQAARIYLDSDPKKPLDAYVSRVDPEASFTPENTYFQNDRVKQVVGLKLMLKDPQGFAKPGMPANGEILIDSEPLRSK